MNINTFDLIHPYFSRLIYLIWLEEFKIPSNTKLCDFELCTSARHICICTCLKWLIFMTVSSCFAIHWVFTHQLNIAIRCTLHRFGGKSNHTNSDSVHSARSNKSGKEWPAMPLNESFFFLCFNTCHMQFCVSLFAIKTCGCVIIADI